MIEYKNLNYQGNNLYNGSEDTGYSVVLWSTRGWKVLWPDGVLSEDFYNLNRARENCRTLPDRKPHRRRVRPEWPQLS